MRSADEGLYSNMEQFHIKATRTVKALVPMKHLLMAALLLPVLAAPALAQDTAPFSLKPYGHFKKMMHMKKTDGVVSLKQALGGPHIYAVGAPAHGTGEITVNDGKLWLDLGADGMGNATHDAADSKAVLLVTARVEKWESIEAPEDMDMAKLHKFILAQAGGKGIDTGKPFPFMLEGTYFDLDWHILNGRKLGGGHGFGGLYKKINEHRGETAGTIIGFYSASSQGVFTHPGSSWHLHVIFESEGKTGHADAVSVRKGTYLKLPVN